MTFTAEEVHFLAAHATEIHAVATELPSGPKLGIQDVQQLRDRFGTHGRAVTELIQARRSTAGKLPGDWLMCQDSAQQSTPPAIAAERMRRIAEFSDAGILDVTCSIGTEGAAAKRAGLEYLGADLDHPRLLMARHNLGGAPLIRADALVPAVKGDRVIVADPARRAGGRRITNPAKLLPPLPDLLRAWAGHPVAVKCAPGLDFSGWDGLVSVSSVDGGVKEACLYSSELTAGERREAVLLDRDGVVDRVTDQLDDRPEEDLAGPPGRFIIDPDGAVVRAGLVRHYAVREGLWMLDERIAYLTGDRIPVGRSGFEFLEQVPLKKLRAALQARDCGSVEILVRGVAVDPDQLRKKLRLRGRRPLTVVCTRIGSAGVALVCGPREFRTTVEGTPPV